MRFPRYFIYCGLVLLCLAPACWAAQTIYQSPVPPGGNPAAVGAPRDDWWATVQSKFDRYGGKHFDIVFDGDSITNRWETTGHDVWARHFAGRAADFGIEGDRVENVIWRLSKGELDGVDPKVIVLMIGTNNISRGDSAENIVEGIRFLIAQYLQAAPNAHLILMGVFPRAQTPADPKRQEVNAINEKLSTFGSDRVTYVDIGPKLMQADGTITTEEARDFLHPEASGYQFWFEAIDPLISQYVTN